MLEPPESPVPSASDVPVATPMFGVVNVGDVLKLIVHVDVHVAPLDSVMFVPAVIVVIAPVPHVGHDIVTVVDVGVATIGDVPRTVRGPTGMKPR